jgi:hypothetical protein
LCWQFGKEGEMTKLIENLNDWEACEASIDWLRTQPDLQTAWESCGRADWLMWLLYEIGYPDKGKLRALACRFVRETKLPNGRTTWDLLTDDRSRKAIETAEAYTRGEATGEELTEARKAAKRAETAARVATMAAAAEARVAAEAAIVAAAIVAAAEARAAARVAARVVAWSAAEAEAAAWSAVAAAAAANEQQAYIIREVVTYEEVISLVSMLTDGGE